MKLSVEKVQEVIRLAEQLHRIHEQKSHHGPITEEDFDDAASYLSSQERKDLVDYIKTLPDDERYELIALVHLGRGDAAASDWERIVKNAGGGKPEDAANYLVSKAPLAKYLRDGMSKLGMS